MYYIFIFFFCCIKKQFEHLSLSECVNFIINHHGKKRELCVLFLIAFSSFSFDELIKFSTIVEQNTNISTKQDEYFFLSGWLLGWLLMTEKINLRKELFFRCCYFFVLNWNSCWRLKVYMWSCWNCGKLLRIFLYLVVLLLLLFHVL